MILQHLLALLVASFVSAGNTDSAVDKYTDLIDNWWDAVADIAISIAIPIENVMNRHRHPHLRYQGTPDVPLASGEVDNHDYPFLEPVRDLKVTAASQFRNCRSNPIQITRIEVTPNPPIADKNIFITVFGTSSTTVEYGSNYTWTSGIPIHVHANIDHATRDLCIDDACPIDPGNVQFNLTLVPSKLQSR